MIFQSIHSKSLPKVGEILKHSPNISKKFNCQQIKIHICLFTVPFDLFIHSLFQYHITERTNAGGGLKRVR